MTRRRAGTAGGGRRRAALLAAAAGAVAGGLAAGAAPAAGQAADGGAELPFRVGEEAVYRLGVALGPAPARPVGSARLAVEAPERVGGRPAYRVVKEMRGEVPLVYSIDDRQVSWIAPAPLRSLRFEEHLRQGDYRRHRRYRLDQEAGSYTRWDSSGEDGGWRRAEGEVDVPMPEHALDEVAFLFFVRTLPLEPGATYRFHRMFEADDNPVVLEVLRRERVRVPAGTFETSVVRPVLRADGLFSEDGRAEVYITDDERRLIVKIESRTSVGRVELSLESYRPGTGRPVAAGPARDAAGPAGDPGPGGGARAP